MRPREVQPLQQRTAQLYPGEVRPLQQQTARPRQPCKLRSWEVRLLQQRQTGRSFFSLFVLVLLFLFSSFFSFSVYVFLEPLSTQVSAARPPALRPQASGRRWLSAGGSGGSSLVAVGAESPRPSTVRPSAAVRPPSTAVVGQQWCEREEVAFKTAAGTAGRDGCRPQYGRLRP